MFRDNFKCIISNSYLEIKLYVPRCVITNQENRARYDDIRSKEMQGKCKRLTYLHIQSNCIMYI